MSFSSHIPRIKQDNILYYIALTLSIFFLLKANTLWEWPKVFIPLFKFGSLAFAAVHFIVYAVRKLNSGAFIIFMIVTPLFITVGIITEQWYRLLISLLLIFGAVNIKFKDILKLYLLAGGSFCLIVMFLNHIGIIKESQNNINNRFLFSDVGYRSGFGYFWCTDFATHIIFLLFTFWYLKRGILTNLNIVAFILIVVFVTYYTDSRMSLFCIILLLFLGIYCRLANKNIIRPGIKTYLFFIALSIGFPVLSFWMVYNYSPTDINWQLANHLSSGRLSLCAHAIQTKGIPILGQFYNMVGSGQDQQTNYIDISYIQIAVIYGSIMLSLILFYFIKTAISSALKKDYITLFAIVFVLGEGVITQHLPLIEFNPLLLLAFAKKDY